MSAVVESDERVCVYCGERIYRSVWGDDLWPWRTVYVLSADTSRCDARCDAEGVVSSGFVHEPIATASSDHDA